MLDEMGSAIESITDHDMLFADIRQESRSTTYLRVSSGTLEEFSQAERAGTVARVLVGECWGQASTTKQLSKDGFRELISDALKQARISAKHSRKDIDLSNFPSLEKSVWQKVKEDPVDVAAEEKLQVIMDLDKAQKIDDRVVNQISVYQDAKREYSLVNSNGSRLEWDEMRVYLVAQSVAKEGSRVEFNYESNAGATGFELIRKIDINDFGEKCAKDAINLLSAGKPPSGTLTVVVDGDIAGLIAHEVCGHASEADEVVKGRSFLTNMVGVEVGSELVTMVDDGTRSPEAGTLPFDSEGTPTSRTLIIDQGVYKGYLHTLETAVIMGVEPTGNGRAQDYNRRIFARMTNTFFDAPRKDAWSNDEIIEDTKDGLYVKRATSGMEDVVGGGVQCSALMGYIIKNGEKQEMVRGMTLAGKVLDILKTVDAVGDSLQFSAGTCGKGEEDFIPVSSGGPHMRAKMVVGGG
jgi:TldD protein